MEKSTRLTSVAGLEMTIPAFFSPIIVINRPIPGVIAVLTASGIDLIIASRRPIAVITMKKIPDINTITSACPYVYHIPSTTVYAKNAFNPMPGA